jgi:putative membrane protein (TIGR04086 family)
MPARRNTYRIYLLSTLLGAAAGALAIPFFSLIIWLLQLPVGISGTFSLLAFGFGCLVAGLSAGRLRRQSGLWNGVKAALILLLVLVIISFIMRTLSGEYFLGRLVTAVLCGSVGGVLGVNRR